MLISVMELTNQKHSPSMASPACFRPSLGSGCWDPCLICLLGFRGCLLCSHVAPLVRSKVLTRTTKLPFETRPTSSNFTHMHHEPLFRDASGVSGRKWGFSWPLSCACACARRARTRKVGDSLREAGDTKSRTCIIHIRMYTYMYTYIHICIRICMYMHMYISYIYR